MQRLPSGEYRWDAHQLPAGDYQVLVDGTGHRTRFTLPPEGDENVRIVVPFPCDVRLRVLDAETGHRIAGDWTPSWYSTSPEWEGGWSHAQTETMPDGTFFFRAPPGQVVVNAHPDGYQWSYETHEIVPGVNEITLQIRRACGVDLTFFDGEAKLPFPDGVDVSLVDAQGRSVANYWSGSRTAAKEPGEYTLRIEGLEAFEPVPERKVTITAGTWTDVEVHLRRKR